jgi:hypothetical protein
MISEVCIFSRQIQSEEKYMIKEIFVDETL